MKILITSIFLFISFTGFTQQATVLFDFDKADLTSPARSTLDSLLRQPLFSGKKIKLFGHTDSVGSYSYNDILSRKRVLAVHEYLFNHGFPKNNIELEALGKRQPLNENADDDQRHANRRVEILIPEIQTPPKNEVVTEISKPRTLSEKITDTATRTGTNIILHNLNFIGGRHVLLPQSEPVLTELLTVMKSNPNLVIQIHGHVCCARGSEDGLDIETNTLDLSVNRAKEVYDYLVQNGINPSRLSYKGFGHQHPLVYPEDTEEKRITNRRVEIRIVKK